MLGVSGARQFQLLGLMSSPRLQHLDLISLNIELGIQEPDCTSCCGSCVLDVPDYKKMVSRRQLLHM
jgi:hypothetical protein